MLQMWKVIAQIRPKKDPAHRDQAIAEFTLMIQGLLCQPSWAGIEQPPVSHLPPSCVIPWCSRRRNNLKNGSIPQNCGEVRVRETRWSPESDMVSSVPSRTQPLLRECMNCKQLPCQWLMPWYLCRLSSLATHPCTASPGMLCEFSSPVP